MTNHTQNPFRAHVDWHHNACIGNYMQFEELANNFLRSADALVACAIDDRGILDVHIYAICFLYRHSFELLLKDLFWKSNYAACGSKEYPRVHELCTLWSGIDLQTRKLLGADFPLTTEELIEVKQLFLSIEDHDPKSYSFRYPFDTKNQRTHPSLTHVNVRALYESTHRVTSYLLRLLDMVIYHYNQRSEYEAECRN